MILTDEQIKEMAIRRGCIEGTAEYYGFIEGAQQARRVLLNPTWRKFSEETPQVGAQIFRKMERTGEIVKMTFDIAHYNNVRNCNAIYENYRWILCPDFLKELENDF